MATSFLELKHLRMIRAIAEKGNITKAAETLFITQSALSQQLKDIENKLGVELFFRSRKRTIPTPAGKNLLTTAEHVIEKIEESELEIARIASGDSGELKVGTQCMFCYKWLPHVIAMFQKRFPNIVFELGNSIHMIQELESKRYDIVISGVPDPENKIAFTPLFEDQVVCLLPKTHALCARDYIRLADFKEVSMIASTEKAQNRFHQLGLKPRGIEPKRYMTISQPQAIVEMVASGFGVTIFPRWAIASLLERGDIAIRPITKTGLPVTWTAAYLKNVNLPVFQREFVHMVRRMKPAHLSERTIDAA